MDAELFTKYEKARILGARALQIAMNAPLLLKIEKDDLERIKFDALKIAEIEFESGVLPINVKKPLPEKKKDALRRVKDIKVNDQELIKKEEEEEKEISEDSEIMELANPEDEDDMEEDSSNETE
jgi:DNA-directed RNA polymerase subunit K